MVLSKMRAIEGEREEEENRPVTPPNRILKPF